MTQSLCEIFKTTVKAINFDSMAPIAMNFLLRRPIRRVISSASQTRGWSRALLWLLPPLGHSAEGGGKAVRKGQLVVVRLDMREIIAAGQLPIHVVINISQSVLMDEGGFPLLAYIALT